MAGRSVVVADLKAEIVDEQSEQFGVTSVACFSQSVVESTDFRPLVGSLMLQVLWQGY